LRLPPSQNTRAMYPDIDEARGHHDLLKQIIGRHAGAASDFRALRRVLDLCRRAAAAVDDRYCRDKVRLIEDVAAEMLSHSEHSKWERDSVSGTQFLRQQILDALELFESRLYSLEAMRRKAGFRNLESLRA
jgi:hypothetical protein